MPKKKLSQSSKSFKNFSAFFQHEIHTRTGTLLFLLLLLIVGLIFVATKVYWTISPTQATIGGGGGGGGYCSSTAYGNYCGNDNTVVNECNYGDAGQVSCTCENNEILYSRTYGHAAFCKYGSFAYSQPDPCAHVTQGDGGYCGNNENGDGAGGTWGSLYYCQNHVAIGDVVCYRSCVHNNSGSDYCQKQPDGSVPYAPPAIKNIQN